MWTLAEAQKRSTDFLEKGIIETIIKVSPMMAKLPFLTVSGNSYKYNRETTMPTASWISVGDIWPESSGTVTTQTANLKILGGDIDIDLFEKQTIPDARAEAEALKTKSKAMGHQWDTDVIYGDDSTNSKQFDGLHILVDSAMQLHQGSSATGAALSMVNLDNLIDLIKPGRPDALIMPRRIKTRLGAYYRDGTAAAEFTMERGDDGKPLPSYGGIPIFLNDFQLMTETIASSAYSASTGGLTGSIFAIRFGNDGLHGIENGGIQKVRIGQLETKDAIRWRLKWYVGLVLKNIYSLARLDGITDAAVTD